jgi:hypothetical protein
MSGPKISITGSYGGLNPTRMRAPICAKCWWRKTSARRRRGDHRAREKRELVRQGASLRDELVRERQAAA